MLLHKKVRDSLVHSSALGYVPDRALSGDVDVPKQEDEPEDEYDDTEAYRATRAAGRYEFGIDFVKPDGTRYGDGLPPGWTSLRILAIAPDWRRRGVGSALMTECLDRARNLGATRMLLHTLPFMPNAERAGRRPGAGRSMCASRPGRCR